MMTTGRFLLVVGLKGRLEARPYKEPNAIVVAGFQPAIIAFRVGMSLEANSGPARTESRTPKKNESHCGAGVPPARSRSGYVIGNMVDQLSRRKNVDFGSHVRS